MGEEAVKLLNGKGTVALMTTAGATNLQRRLDGVLEVLAKHPGIRVIETFDVREDSVKAAELIATGSNRYPDLGAWISVGGWPVFNRNALRPVPKGTFVISFDTIKPAPELLKEGRVQILIGQKYFGWGEEPVKMLAGIKAGKMPTATDHRLRRRRRPGRQRRCLHRAVQEAGGGEIDFGVQVRLKADTTIAKPSGFNRTTVVVSGFSRTT